MRIRAVSICASAALAAGLMGVTGGTASADPADPACVAINTTIQGQLSILGQVAISNPPVFLQTAPGILASIQALRTARPDCGGPPVPTLEQLIPPPPRPPAPVSPDIVDQCGRYAQQWAGYMDAQPLLIPILAIMAGDVMALCDGMKALTG